MDKKDQRVVAWRELLPSWVLDQDVISFLGTEKIELIVVFDEKFRCGTSEKPLIVLRGMKSSNESLKAREQLFDEWELLE